MKQSNFRFKLLALLLTVAAFAFSACQQASVDTVNSNKIETSQVYQHYFIQADRNQSQVTATFRVGGATGTTIELSAPGKIIYNGAALDKSDPSNFIGTNYRVKGTDYRKTISGYQANHQFVYTDSSSRTYQNSLNLAPLEIAAKAGLTLNKKANSKIPFSRPLAANETISLSIANSTVDSIPDQYKTVYLSAQRDAIILTPAFWKNRTTTGDNTISIKVRKISDVSQGTPLGGSIIAEYTSVAVGVKFGSAAVANSNANTQSPANAATANVENAETNANIANANSAANANTGAVQKKGKRPIGARKRLRG